MKRFCFVAVLLSAFMFYGCEKNSGNDGAGTKSPLLTSTAVELKATYEGGDYSITYTLSNPAEDGVLLAEGEGEWITNVNYDRLGIVTFDVAPNDAYEAREGEIRVEYRYSDTLSAVSVKIIQEAMPEPQWDIELLDAPVLSGYYYGTQFSDDGTFYYYFHLSNVGFGPDGYALPNGMFFRLGLFSDKSPEDLSNITLPEGTYVLGGTGAGSIDAGRSQFFVTNADGTNGGGHAYKELTVKITNDGSVVSIDVVAVLDDESLAHATYSGSGLVENSVPDVPGAYSTLTGDYEADFSRIDAMTAYYLGDFYATGAANWIILSEESGDGMQLDFCCEDMGPEGLVSGTYKAGDAGEAGKYIIGSVEGSYLMGSWYMKLEGTRIVGMAPAKDGDIDIQKNDDGTYTITLDCIDDKGYNFTGSWTGELTMKDQSQANVQGYSVVKRDGKMRAGIDSVKPGFLFVR